MAGTLTRAGSKPRRLSGRLSGPARARSAVVPLPIPAVVEPAALLTQREIRCLSLGSLTLLAGQRRADQPPVDPIVLRGGFIVAGVSKRRLVFFSGKRLRGDGGHWDPRGVDNFGGGCLF